MELQPISTCQARPAFEAKWSLELHDTLPTSNISIKWRVFWCSTVYDIICLTRKSVRLNISANERVNNKTRMSLHFPMPFFHSLMLFHSQNLNCKHKSMCKFCAVCNKISFWYSKILTNWYMILKLQFFWELTEGGSPPSFSRAFSSTWQGLSALPHTRIGQILASLANSCLGASICPMRVWLTSCRFALALSQTFNVCWEYGQICACVSPYFPTFPDISCPPKESFSGKAPL